MGPGVYGSAAAQQQSGPVPACIQPIGISGGGKTEGRQNADRGVCVGRSGEVGTGPGGAGPVPVGVSGWGSAGRGRWRRSSVLRW